MASLPSLREVRQWVAGRTAKYMFWLSMAYLVCLACLVVLWVDIPNLHEKVMDNGDTLRDPGNRQFESIVIAGMLIVWPIVILESIFHWCTRPWDRAHSKAHWFGLLHCICPALRMCGRFPEMHGRMWLPGLGWRRPNRHLRQRLERLFSVPMIVIALMIMPVLIIEFFLKAQVAQYSWLRFALHVGTGVIWFAFAAEFILMVSVSNKKLAYCKKHWIDIAIILLPLFSFLRSLRAMRATRLSSLLRVPQVGKMARIYRMRGTAVKAVQALVLLEVFQKWLGANEEKKLDKLRRQLKEVESEGKVLRRQIAKLEAAVAQQCVTDDQDEQPLLGESVSDSRIQGPHLHGPHLQGSHPTPTSKTVCPADQHDSSAS